MRKLGKAFCAVPPPPVVATVPETLTDVLVPPPHAAARSATPAAKTARLTHHIRRSLRVNSSTSALTAARPGLRVCCFAWILTRTSKNTPGGLGGPPSRSEEH